MCDKVPFQLTKHKELWNFLAENPTASKEDWDGWKRYGDWDEEESEPKVEDGCYACEYARKFGNDVCPLAVKSLCLYDPRICLNGLYYKWHVARDLKIRSRLAREIRDFPVREGIPTE